MAKKSKGKSFHVGEHVAWDSEAGNVSGSIKAIHKSPFKLYGKDGTAYVRHASKDNPVYEIKSGISDHLAYHYADALHKAENGMELSPFQGSYYNPTEDTMASGGKVWYHYRSAIGHGEVVGIAKKGKDKAHTKYKIKEFDHHVSNSGSKEPKYVYHYGSALHEAKNGIALTPREQTVGLNNPNYNQMFFPMQGSNTFRGLDSGEPVHLIDGEGNQATLHGPDDTAKMYGNVQENKNMKKAKNKKAANGLPIPTPMRYDPNYYRDQMLQPINNFNPASTNFAVPDKISTPNFVNQFSGRAGSNRNSNNERDSIFSGISPLGAASVLSSVVDAAIPYPQYKPLNTIPMEYNAHPYGTGSQAIYQTGGNVPKKQLTDQQIYDDYMSQLKGNPDASRLASIFYLSGKYHVPTNQIFTQTQRTYDGSMPIRREYQFTMDGKPVRLIQDIGGSNVGSYTEAPSLDANTSAPAFASTYQNGGNVQQQQQMQPQQSQQPQTQRNNQQQEQQIIQDIGQALSHGQPPQKVVQDLVKQGIPERQAAQIVTQVIHQMQQQSQQQNQQEPTPVQPNQQSLQQGMASGGGLSRSTDYGSKSHPYAMVNANDFAGPHRSYPIPTEKDGVDALRLVHMHHDQSVISNVYKKYPELRKAQEGDSLLPFENYDFAASGIHINPKNKGKFTATKKKTGKTTEQLAHSKNPLTRKRAQFALNASHWNKAENGMKLTDGEYDLTPQEIGYYRSMGYNIEPV